MTPRIILRESVNRKLIDRVIVQNQWRLLNIQPARRCEGEQLIVGSDNGVDLIAFIRMHAWDAQYVELTGHAPDPCADILRAQLPCHDARSIMALARSPLSIAHRCRGILYLGLSASDENREEHLSWIQRARETDTPELQHAASLAQQWIHEGNVS